MKAAIYARYSSDNQREESITAQIRAAHEYCQKNGHKVIKEYTDEALSARTDDRPAFQQMITDAQEGLFEVLIVHKIDRFSRNRYDAAFYKRQLSRAGIKIVYVEQQLDDSPESIILESVLEGMAEYYSKNLAREVQKGMKETALQARHNGGTPPLGYSVNSEKRYEIIPEEADAIKLIFRSVLQKYSYREICDTLNKKGYRTKKGSLFRSNSLFDILKNPKYCGTYVFGRTQGGRQFPRNTHADHTPIVEIEDAIPAIISKSDWKEVQSMLKNRKMPARQIKGKTDYLLSGYITCECGSTYCGTRQKSTAKNVEEPSYFYYYKCNRNKNGKDKPCGTPQLRCNELDELVLTELWKILEEPAYKETFINLIITKSNQNISNIEPDIEKMEKQHQALIKKREAYTEAIANGATYLAKEAQEAHDNAKAIEEAITLRKTQTEKIDPTTLEKNINKIYQEIKKSPDINRTLIAHLLDHIEVTKQEINIYLTIPKGLCVKMVEARGVEPLSRGTVTTFSPSAVCF